MMVITGHRRPLDRMIHGIGLLFLAMMALAGVKEICVLAFRFVAGKIRGFCV